MLKLNHTKESINIICVEKDGGSTADFFHPINIWINDSDFISL